MIELELDDSDFFSLKLQKKARLQSIADYYKLPRTGSKNEILSKIYNHRWGFSKKDMPSLHGGFTLESTMLENSIRPSGVRIKLGSLETTKINAVLGLTVNPEHGVFNELLNLIPAEDSQNLVKCYKSINDDRINKSICIWCAHSEECDKIETRIIRESSSYSFLEIGEERVAMENDRKTIIEFMRSKSFVVSYNERLVRMPFTSHDDIFKPMFGNHSDRQMHIVPADYCIDDKAAPVDKYFPHVFYSKLLHRSITVYEAALMDCLTTKTFESNRKFPTINDCVEWFHDNIGINESESLHKIASSILRFVRKNLNYYDKKSKDENYRESDDISYFQHLLASGRDMFNLEVSDHEVELFSMDSIGKTFYESIARFLNNLWIEITQIPKFRNGGIKTGGVPLFETRLESILLYPAEIKYDFHFFSIYRVLRSIPIKNLKSSYLVVDGLASIFSSRRKKSQLAAGKKVTFNESGAIPISEVLNLSNSKSDPFVFSEWDKSSNLKLHKSDNLILIYHSENYHEACSMNSYLKNLERMKGDEDYFLKLEYFDTFMEVFYSSFDLFRENLVEQGQQNMNLRIELNNPKIRKRTAYEKLVLLSERMPEQVTRTIDPDENDRAEGKITEQFILRNGRYNVVLRREKQLARTYQNVQTFDIQSDFYNYRQGTTFNESNEVLIMLLESLNKGSSQDNFNLPFSCIFLSELVRQQLCDLYPEKAGIKIIRKFIKIINSLSSNSVTFFCLQSEKSNFLNLGSKFMSFQIRSDFNLICWTMPNSVGHFSKFAYFSGKRVKLGRGND